MSVFVPWGTRRSSIFDLEHIGGLSASPTIPLFVSPQVLYALQNVALVEIADPARYAVSLADGGYYRLQPGDADEYAQFLEIVSQTGLQLSDYLTMSTILNFQDQHTAQAVNTNAPAGVNSLTIEAPAGKAFFIQAYHVVNINTINTQISVSVGTVGGNLTQLDLWTSPAAGTPNRGRGPITIADPAGLTATFVGCVAGDDIYLRAYGYVMELLV